MLALLQNEYTAQVLVVLLVLGIAIHKFYGLGKFFRLFTGSRSRVAAARRAANDAAEAAETAKAVVAKAEAEEAEKKAAETAAAAAK